MTNSMTIQSTDSIRHAPTYKSTAPNVFTYRQRSKNEDNSVKIMAGLAGVAVLAVAGIMIAKKGKVKNEKIHINPLPENNAASQASQVVSENSKTLGEKVDDVVEDLVKKVKIPDDHLEKEGWMSALARKYGVNTPEIKDGVYEMTGEIANPKTNPLTVKHLENMRNNILAMDKNYMWHGDLDIGNIYYAPVAQTSQVANYASGFTYNIVDGKFVSNFPDREILYPEYLMPSNMFEYEGYSLGKYLSGMDNAEDQANFVREYLKVLSPYHSERAAFLKEKNMNNAYSGQMFEYENLQAQIFKKPSKEIVELRQKRIDFKHKERLAFTDWDEGGGANGFEFSPQRRLDAIMEYMDCMESTIDYIRKAQGLIGRAKSDNMINYLNNEAGFGHFWLNKYQDWVRGMAEYNFRHPQIIQAPEAERNAILGAFDAISRGTVEEKPAAIEKFRELYRESAKKYNFELN